MKTFEVEIHLENLDVFFEKLTSYGASIISFKKCNETIFEFGIIKFRAPESSYDKIKEILGEEFLENEVESI